MSQQMVDIITSQLGKHTVANIDLALVGMIIALHVVLNLAAKAVYGNKRNTGAVMGGQGDGGDPKKQNLQESQTSPVSQIIAYNVIAVGYATFCAVVGTTAWYDGSAAAVGGSAHERLYGRSEAFEKLGTLTASYEVYNVVAVSIIAEYRNFAFIGHHSITLVLAVLANHPFLHYYGIFFFGLSGISSVPLALIELFTVLRAGALLELCRGLFAFSFLAFRTFYWPVVSYGFWQDVLHAYNSQTVHSVAAAGFFLFANVFLTGLQLFWTTKIIAAVGETLGLAGGAAKKHAD